MRLDFRDGRFDEGEPTAVRTVRDLREIWQTEPDPTDDRVVYRTYGLPGADQDQPDLLYASTVIEPGDVHGEYFMTRGHFHVKPERGEWMLALRGQGTLVLRDRAGKAWSEPLMAGLVCLIDGSFAHRVVNTGNEPLVFVVTWLADCGHDYETIRREGFGLRVDKSAPTEIAYPLAAFSKDGKQIGEFGTAEHIAQYLEYINVPDNIAKQHPEYAAEWDLKHDVPTIFDGCGRQVYLSAFRGTLLSIHLVGG